MHTEFVYESVCVCKFCHLCARVVVSKELLWEKLCTETGFISKCVCVSCWQTERHDVSWISIFAVIYTQWTQCTVDLKMSLSCFNRHSYLFMVISNARIAWIIFNQRDSYWNNRLLYVLCFCGYLIHPNCFPFSPRWATLASSIWNTKGLGPPNSTSRAVQATARHPVWSGLCCVLCDSA